MMANKADHDDIDRILNNDPSHNDGVFAHELGIKINMPDLDAYKKILVGFSAKRKEQEHKQEKAKAIAKSKAETLKKELENAPSNLNTTGFQDQLAAFQGNADISTILEDSLDGEHVIFVARPEEPVLDLKIDDFASTASTAVSSLNLGGALQQNLFPQDNEFLNTIFRHSVVSGTISSKIISTRQCNDTIAKSLFDLIAYSNDTEVSACALYTLMTALGVDEVPGLLLDAVPFPFSSSLSPSSPLAFSKPTAAMNDNVTITALPTAHSILSALKANGFDPKRATPSASSTLLTQQTQQGEQKESLRIFSIKLLLHTIMALSKHCSLHPSKKSTVFPPAATSELLLSLLHLHLDPCSLQLQAELHSSTAYLLDCFDQDGWKVKLPYLADRLSLMGNSFQSRLRILKQLLVLCNARDPIAMHHIRAFQLQQYAGCGLISILIPCQTGKKSSSSSSIPKGEIIPHPATVLRSQSWFSKAKELAGEAGVAQNSSPKNKKGYSIGDVEVLLRVCHLVLWPHLLYKWSCHARNNGSVSGNAPSCQLIENDVLSDAFVMEWNSFLSILRRNIKGLRPEDVATKTLANYLEIEYKRLMPEKYSYE